MEYLAKVRLLCDKRQTLIIKYANIMGRKKRSNSMQTTYTCIKTNRGRHHDIPGHTKTKIKLMVSNLSYAAACSSLDLHCKGRALRPSLQSPTLGIFRAAPPCRLLCRTTMGKAYGPTADGIRCCRPWHTTPPGIAPYATAMALHPTGQVHPAPSREWRWHETAHCNIKNGPPMLKYLQIYIHMYIFAPD